ncbi:MAG: anthranilate synthase component I, partial [Sphingopyxis sp.]
MTGSVEGAAAARLALGDGKPALLWAKCIADTETPVSAALKLIEGERGDWLLESVEGGETRGRYSLIGLAPDLMFRANGRNCEINRHWATDRAAFAPLDSDPLAALRDLVAECRIDPLPDALPAALACLVGYFAYESYGLVEAITRPPANPIAVPDMLFVRPSVILIFDRLADMLWIVAPAWPSETAPARAVAAAEKRVEAVIARLASPLVHNTAQAEPVEALPFLSS